MPNKKTGKILNCLYCGKEFYINKQRLERCKRHYCSLKCVSRYTAKERGDKQRKKIYPYISDKICPTCGKNLIIKSSQFDKEYDPPTK